MSWQIFAAVVGFLFAGRTMLFVLGFVLGGMLTVASNNLFVFMSMLTGWWNGLVSFVIG